VHAGSCHNLFPQKALTPTVPVDLLQSQNLGQYLKSLLDAREEADYEYTKSITVVRAETAIDDSSDAMDLVNALSARELKHIHSIVSRLGR